MIPEVSGEQHVTPDGRLGVYRTGDGGASWQLAANGLPERAWVGGAARGIRVRRGGRVFRHAERLRLDRPPGGASWIEAVRDLPPILSVEAANV